MYLLKLNKVVELGFDRENLHSTMYLLKQVNQNFGKGAIDIYIPLCIY